MSELFENPQATEVSKPGEVQGHLSSQSELMKSFGENIWLTSTLDIYQKIYKLLVKGVKQTLIMLASQCELDLTLIFVPMSFGHKRDLEKPLFLVICRLTLHANYLIIFH